MAVKEQSVRDLVTVVKERSARVEFCVEDLVVSLDVGGVFGGDVRVGGGAGGGLGAGWGVFLRVFVFLTALGLLLGDTLGLSGSFVTGVRGELVDVF